MLAKLHTLSHAQREAIHSEVNDPTSKRVMWVPREVR